MKNNEPVQTFVPSHSEQQCGELQESAHLVPIAGVPCPRCGQATLVYNGMLQVVCPECGYQAEGGAFT